MNIHTTTCVLATRHLYFNIHSTQKRPKNWGLFHCAAKGLVRPEKPNHHMGENENLIHKTVKPPAKIKA